MGETLALGRYSFHGGFGGLSDEEEDLFQDDDDKSQIDPALRSTNSSRPPTRSATPGPSRPSSSESQAEKRHRESSSLSIGSNNKRIKASGISVIDKMSEGLFAMAEAVATPVVEQVAAKETVDSTLQGQAQQQIQDVACLTIEGQLVLLELLTDGTLARTYLAIKDDDLRAKWLKKQLTKYLNNSGESTMEELFIEWDSTQG